MAKVSTRGSIPSRSDQLLGHSHGRKDVVTPDKPPAGDVVTVPPVNPTWHPVSVMLWNAMFESGMEPYFESTDWAAAYLICDQISMQMKPQYIGMQVVGPAGRQEPLYDRKPMTGGEVNAFMSALGKLGLTEGDRRRLGIELQRAPVEDVGTEGDRAIDAVKQGLRVIAGGQSA